MDLGIDKTNSTNATERIVEIISIFIGSNLPIPRETATLFFCRKWLSFADSGYRGLAEGEAAEGVFADASEVEGVVAFDDVGDLGVAVGRVVLKVVDHAAGAVEAEDK